MPRNDDTDELFIPLTDGNSKKKFTTSYNLVDTGLFIKKTIFICCASYCFIPIMSLHNSGKLTSLVYAGVLVGLHLVFVVVYFYKVKFSDLSYSRASFWGRVLGLFFCVGLLMVVAGNLDEDLSKLSLELLGLCAVHTVILALLMVKCERIEVIDDDIEDQGGTKYASPMNKNGVKVLLYSKHILNLGAMAVAAFYINTQPLIGAGTSSLMSILGTIADFVQYKLRRTRVFPKFLDSTLALLWVSLFLMFWRLPDDKQEFLRIYCGPLINASLVEAGIFSICLGKPWIYQYALDHVEPRLFDKSNLEYNEDSSQGFRYVCTLDPPTRTSSTCWIPLLSDPLATKIGTIAFQSAVSRSTTSKISKSRDTQRASNTSSTLTRFPNSPTSPPVTASQHSSVYLNGGDDLAGGTTNLPYKNITQLSAPIQPTVLL